MGVSRELRTEDVVTEWFAVAEGSPPPAQSPFFRFIAAWIAFNAHYGDRYPDARDDADAIERFAADLEARRIHDRLLRDDRTYREAVDSLSEGVFDYGTRRTRRVDRERSLESILRCLYAVRCNLFHGNKALVDLRDRRVVQYGLDIMTRILRPLVAVYTRTAVG